jgi:hypothetical protein
LAAGRFKSLVGFETLEKKRDIEISKIIKKDTCTINVTKQKVHNNDNNYYFCRNLFHPALMPYWAE